MVKFKQLAMVLFAICILILGVFIGFNSWDQNIYVQWNPINQRQLASKAPSPHKEILNFSVDQLADKASKTLLTNSEVIKKDQDILFYLSNVLMVHPKTQTQQFVCEIFSSIEFSFIAINIMLNGEPSRMMLQTPCLHFDENQIGPFSLPYKMILASPSQNIFEIFEKNIFIRFYNASILLSSQWALTNIRFFNEDPSIKDVLIQFSTNTDHLIIDFKSKQDNF